MDRYNKEFENCAELITPYQAEGCNNSYHLYVIRLKSKDRKEVFLKLREAGIGVNVHYIPVNTQPYYRKYYEEHNIKNPVCPNAMKYYETAISLPLYPELTEEQQDYVIQKLLEAIKAC